MRVPLAILASVLILVGVGNLLTAPAGTISVPVSAEIQSAADQAPRATQTDAVQPAATGAADSGGTLAAWKRHSGAGGGCCNGACGIANSPVVKHDKKVVEKKVTKTKTVEAKATIASGGHCHPVAHIAAGICKKGCGLLGHERRAARRHGRRGGGC